MHDFEFLIKKKIHTIEHVIGAIRYIWQIRMMS